MQEWLQPYVSIVVQALVGLLTVIVLAGLYSVKQKVFQWLDAKTSESERSTLHGIAEEAFAQAETSLRGSAGPWKMEAAAGYAADRLGALGLSLSNAEIRAAIEKAVLDYNARVKPPVADNRNGTPSGGPGAQGGADMPPVDWSAMHKSEANRAG